MGGRRVCSKDSFQTGGREQRGCADGVCSTRGKRLAEKGTGLGKYTATRQNLQRSGKMCGDPTEMWGGPANTGGAAGTVCGELVQREASPATRGKRTGALARRRIALERCGSPGKICTAHNRIRSNLLNHAVAFAKHAVTLINYAADPAKCAVMPVKHAAAR